MKVDADLTSMDSYRSHLQSLICPSNTFMVIFYFDYVLGIEVVPKRV